MEENLKDQNMDKIDCVVYSDDKALPLVCVFLYKIVFNSIFLFCNYPMWLSVSDTLLLNFMELSVSQENKIAYHAFLF